MTDRPLIEISDMTIRFGSRVIFDRISLRIPRGKVVSIMGPSGTGKTTLLKAIGGQLLPDAGDVMVDGVTVNRTTHQELFEVRKRLGMMFQSGALFTGMSVFDNVAFPLRQHTGFPESMIRILVLMKLQAVGLRGAHVLMPSELSGGMARRVALARAIVLDPMVIMYDEPFTGLDPITVAVIMHLIRELNQSLGITSIIVSHDVEEVTSISDYTYILADGNVIAEGDPETVKDSRSAWVQQFMQGKPDGPVPFQYPAPDYREDLLAGMG